MYKNGFPDSFLCNSTWLSTLNLSEMQQPVILFGSSGHARSIAVILEQLDIEIVGFIDSYLPKGTTILNYKTLGDESVLSKAKQKFGTLKIIIGIGDCCNRMKVVQKVRCLNPKLVYPPVISPKACVAAYTHIGQGTVVFCNSFINVEATIGDFCVVNSCSIIEHNTCVGNFCSISPGANIGGNVIIGDHSFIGSSATIIQKKTIGSNCVIGAGAIVTKNIPDQVLAVGMPAIVKRENYINNNIFN